MTQPNPCRDAERSARGYCMPSLGEPCGSCHRCETPGWGPCESCNASHEGCQFYWMERGPCCGADCLHEIRGLS